MKKQIAGNLYMFWLSCSFWNIGRYIYRQFFERVVMSKFSGGGVGDPTYFSHMPTVEMQTENVLEVYSFFFNVIFIKLQILKEEKREELYPLLNKTNGG